MGPPRGKPKFPLWGPQYKNQLGAEVDLVSYEAYVCMYVCMYVFAFLHSVKGKVERWIDRCLSTHIFVYLFISRKTERHRGG